MGATDAVVDFIGRVTLLPAERLNEVFTMAESLERLPDINALVSALAGRASAEAGQTTTAGAAR
jgi:hypothetical protein